MDAAVEIANQCFLSVGCDDKCGCLTGKRHFNRNSAIAGCQQDQAVSCDGKKLCFVEILNVSDPVKFKVIFEHALFELPDINPIIL